MPKHPDGRVEELLEARFGGLDDFSTEFAEAVRAVLRETIELDSHDDLVAALPDTGNPLMDFQQMGRRVARVRRNNQVVDSSVATLRRLRLEGKANDYAYVLQLTLDVIKYDIKNAQAKSGLRRTLERAWKRLIMEM